MADEQAVRLQLRRSPFVDDGLLRRWESAWEKLWQRPALAFAEPQALILALKSVLGWRSGDLVGGDPLLDPAWTEALADAWLQISWYDVDPRTGQAQESSATCMSATSLPRVGMLKAGLVQHAFGLPTTRPQQHGLFWLEEISSVLQPMPGCGWGDVQLLHLSGNRMLAAGASCLLLTRDEALFRALRDLRQHPPNPLACALGLSQLQGLDRRLERRRELAERYQKLYSQGLFRVADGSLTGRVWEMFLLEMHTCTGFLDLQQFLQKARIHAASPLWFTTQKTAHLPGFKQFNSRVLALPLYASLTDSAHKRIINRIHRWVEYTMKATGNHSLLPKG